MADSIYDQLRSTLKHLRYTLYFGVVVITLIAFGGLLQPYLLSEYINYTFYPMLTMLMIVVFRSTIKAMTLSIRAYGDTIFDEHRKTLLQGFMELACFSKVLDLIDAIVNALILIAVLTSLPYLDVFLPSIELVDKLKGIFGEMFSITLAITVPHYIYYAVLSLSLVLYLQSRQLKTWAKLLD